MHITDIPQPRTVDNIINYFGEAYIEGENGPRLDGYHLLIVEAAYRLRRNGLTQFEYYTGWGSATQWISPDSGYLVVHADGTLT